MGINRDTSFLTMAQKERGRHHSQIPKEQPEEKLISVYSAVIQLKKEGYEVSRGTIYRWIKQAKIPGIKDKYGRKRLTQEGVEKIKQLLDKRKQKKALKEYIIKVKGIGPEGARKSIQHQLNAGKTLEDIARKVVLIRKTYHGERYTCHLEMT